jgi:site-specific recombinase XerD
MAERVRFSARRHKHQKNHIYDVFVMAVLWFSERKTMANTKVALMMRVKTDEGWGHYRAAYSANGKVKPRTAVVAGREVEHKQGYYELRFYEGDKPKYEALRGATAAAAEDARKLKEAKMSVVKGAEKHGVKLATVDTVRRLLSHELRKFLKDTSDNGAHEAADVYRLACDEFLAVIDSQYVDDLVHSDVRKFQAALEKRGMSARTVKNRHTSVKAFLKYLGYDYKGKDAAGNPFPKAPRYDEELPEVYSDQELNDLFNRVRSGRENLLYMLLLQTGLREREAMPLEWTDINWEMRTLKVQSKLKWKSRIKTWEQREQTLSDDLLKRLKAHHLEHGGESTLIFGKRMQKGPMEGRIGLDGHMLRTLKQQVRAAGLNCGICEGCVLENPKRSLECEKWYLHKFRATYGTKMLRDGIDLRTVQKMMGHKEITSTMRYVRPAENIQIQDRINNMKWY